MRTSDEFSESQKGGTSERRADLVARLSALEAGNRETPSSIDIEELRRRLGEAREHTKALIGNYVETCSGLKTALAGRREAAAERDRVRSELSASIARFARLLRALGEPPERTLVLIKTTFSEAAPHQDDDNRAVLEDIVKWVVDAYYVA